MKRLTVSCVALLILISGCSFNETKLVNDSWDHYELSVLDRRLNFSLPAGGAFYREPRVRISEVNDNGFIYIFRAGFGSRRADGYDPALRLSLQVKPFVDGPIVDPDLQRLKQAIQASGDASSRRTGRPLVDRMDDFETHETSFHDWVLLEHPKPSVIMMSTAFNDEFYLSLFIELPRHLRPDDRAWIDYKNDLLTIAQRIEISRIAD